MRLAWLGSCLALFGWFRASGPEQYFAHWHADAACMAPDGRHLAYLEEAGSTHVEAVVVDCDHPDQKKTYRLAIHSPLSDSTLGVIAWRDPSRFQVDLPDRSHWLVGGAPEPQALGSGAKPVRATVEPADAALADKFPGRTVSVTGWDQPRQRAVLWVHSASEAGRYFLYDRPTDRLTEFVGRLPLLHWADLAEVQTFVVPGNRPRPALYSAPRNSAERSLPLILLCRGGEIRPEALAYEPYAQALCAAGYAVLEVSVLPGDSSAAAARGQMAGLDLALSRFNVDRTQVTALGVGDDLALRVAKQHAERFRCGAAIGIGSFGSDPEEGDPSDSEPTNPESGATAVGSTQRQAIARGKGGVDSATEDGRYYSVPTRFGSGPTALTIALRFMQHHS